MTGQERGELNIKTKRSDERSQSFAGVLLTDETAGSCFSGNSTARGVKPNVAPIEMTAMPQLGERSGSG